MVSLNFLKGVFVIFSLTLLTSLKLKIYIPVGTIIIFLTSLI